MKVGFIGVGKMGNPFAKHLTEAGNDVNVHDINEDAAASLIESGAAWTGTPSRTAQGRDVVFTSLPMPKDVQAVCLGPDGIIEGIPKGSIVADLSTNAPSAVREIHAVFAQRGVEFMDVALSGGPRGVANKDLCMMAGGSKDAYDRIKPLLEQVGDKPVYCGPIGNGAVCKLTHNLFAYMLQWSIGEVLTMGVKAGVDLETLVEAVSKSGMGKRPPFEGWANGTALMNFDPDPFGFALELARKDVGLATDMAREHGVPLEFGSIVEQKLMEAMNRGWGKKKAGVIRLLQEERSRQDLKYKS